MSDTPPPLQPQASSYGSPAPQNPGSGSGKKWGIGCGIGCLLVLVVGVVLAVVGFNMAKKAVVDFVEKGTSEAPVELVAPVVSPAAVESAMQRFDEFTTAMESGTPTGPLVLTGDDINALIANHPKFSAVADAMVVSMVGEQLTGKVSLNIDDLNLPPSFLSESLAGKYFNGEVTLSVGVLGGRPAMFIEGLSVGGAPLPAPFLSEISKENLLQDAGSNPELQKYFDKIDELKVEDGKLTITPVVPVN